MRSREKPFAVGLRLFKEHGGSKVLTAIFEKGGDTFYNRKRLLKELTTLEKAEESVPLPPPQAPAPAEPTPASTTPAASQAWRKKKSKEVYPEKLHPAYDRLEELYTLINHLHPQLDAMYMTNISECHKAVQKLVKAWDEIDDIYNLLQHWEDTGQVQQNKYLKEKVENRFDRDYYMRRLLNLRTYISRDKDNAKKADKVAAWKKEMVELEKLLG